jgi:hypothetical protein
VADIASAILSLSFLEVHTWTRITSPGRRPAKNNASSRRYKRIIALRTNGNG